MTDTINLPGLGKTSKTTAYALGGVVVLVGGIAWYRSRGAASSTSSSAPAQADTDPATGYPYGSAEDTAALAQQAQSTSGVGLSDFTGGGGTNTSVSTTTGYTSNAAWSQAAEDYLVNTVGSHADVVGNALGKYITGQPLTTDQVSVVEQSIAFAGYPPVNGPSGYPPSYRTAVTTPTTPAPVTGAGPVTGLHAQIFKEHVTLTWQTVAGAKGYHVDRNGARVMSVEYGQAVVWGLKPHTRYTFRVTPTKSDGSDGKPASITVTTKK
jgi:hypothetical protein